MNEWIFRSVTHYFSLMFSTESNCISENTLNSHQKQSQVIVVFIQGYPGVGAIARIQPIAY